MHVPGGEIGADAAQEFAQRRPRPLSDRAPTFHANEPGDLRLLRQRVELLQRPRLLGLDQAVDDQILPTKFGFPLRIRIPTKLGFKNPKHVIGLAVLNHYTGGYWEDQGYNWFSGL